jgi:AbiV family abortive infection protein
MPDHIPQKDLEEGLRIIRRNIESLIDTSTLLNNNRKFLHSTIFSLLALEEMSKGQLLFEHYRKKTDIPMTEWKRITGRKGHYEKMIRYLETLQVNPEAVREHPEITTREIIELTTEYYVRLKLNVLYVNWDKRLCKWHWIPDNYGEDVQKERSDQLLVVAKNGYEKYPIV